jgi:hypothetical protein
MGEQGTAWLARVRHDLVKRMLWAARDRRDLGGEVRAGELVAKLLDDEGRPIATLDLWRRLDQEAPDSLSISARLAFARALAEAEAGARNDRLEPVLALEAAFEALARHVKGG